jgi:acetylornithine deacetylase/succinyl-diaminopimelate desuccinylase-like protein
VRRAALALAVLALAAMARAQQDAAGLGDRLLAEPPVRAALDRVHANEPWVLAEQARLCEIPAPTFHEKRRAAAMKAHFEAEGLQRVRVDAVGNLLGERPGRSARPHVVVAAHLDTVFPEGTNVTVAREGARLKGPGIGDNCRGLAAMIGVVRALREAAVTTEGTITFVANVREEGLGNLEGAKHLFQTELAGRVDRFVSIDGSGIGFVHVGVGARRYRVTFKGRGGHSYFAFGRANPAHALGRAVAKLAELSVPAEPKTTFNVGRVGGGTSVNSIAAEVWLELDMRSHDPAALEAVDSRARQVVAEAVREENARWGGKGPVVATIEEIGHRVPGMTPLDAPIVQATLSVTRALGLPVEVFPATTDANVAMAAGVPAVTLDGGGGGTGGHSPAEVFDSTDSWKGTQRALLVVLALSRP